jgi:hypothetical protein
MALEAGELDLIREADAVRKVGTHQARVEANLSEVGHICEQFKRRLSAIRGLDWILSNERLLNIAVG